MKVQFSFFNPHHSIRPSAGFTLIELVIVLAILAIMGTSTFAVSNTYIQSQKLNSAVDNLKTALNEAKSSALSQTIVTTGAGSCGTAGMTLIGDQIYFPNSTSYRLKEVCKNSSGVISYPAIRTTTLPSGMTHDQAGVTVQFNIQSAGGGTNLSSDRNIVLNLGGRVRTVTVTVGGLIK